MFSYFKESIKKSVCNRSISAILFVHKKYSMKKFLIFFLPLCAIILLGLLWLFYTPAFSPVPASEENPSKTTQISPQKSVNFPMDNALSRVTKKTF